ncbi:MAG TPA: hypothetical protein PKA90_06115 [Ignavibacteria bacterium]|nr:hypothetical protein [Ignavibacteria bacterium]HMR39989.1 hypothetical protein [Ignavibacteria bacterium]
MAFESDKTMFEIYREKEFNKKFKVVYYTELTEHNKEAEINHAIAGETIYDGYIKDNTKEKGKIIIKELIDEMNSKQSPIDKEEILKRLEDCLA